MLDGIGVEGKHIQGVVARPVEPLRRRHQMPEREHAQADRDRVVAVGARDVNVRFTTLQFLDQAMRMRLDFQFAHRLGRIPHKHRRDGGNRCHGNATSDRFQQLRSQHLERRLPGVRIAGSKVDSVLADIGTHGQRLPEAQARVAKSIPTPAQHEPDIVRDPRHDRAEDEAPGPSHSVGIERADQ